MDIVTNGMEEFNIITLADSEVLETATINTVTRDGTDQGLTVRDLFAADNDTCAVLPTSSPTRLMLKAVMTLIHCKIAGWNIFKQIVSTAHVSLSLVP